MSVASPTAEIQTRLGEIAKTRMGKTILSKELTDSGIPVYSAGRENGPWGYVSSSDLQFGNETIVISARGNIGFPRVPLCTPFVTTQTTIAISLNDARHVPYLRYQLETVDWSRLTSQTTIPMITVRQVEGIEVKLPPLVEQRRVVAEIEKQFTRLDAGVAALRRVQANLKRYRAAVLKAACEGRLVPTEAELAKAEGRTFETGEQLLTRILADRRKNWNGRGKYKEPAAPDTANLPLLPEGWAWAACTQIGEAVTGFTPPKSNPGFFGGDVPFFKPTDLDAGYNVREFRDSLTEEGAHHGRVLPPLSILVTCIGATIGKAGLARVRCTTNQQINALVVPDKFVSPKYVYWYFCSPFGQRQILDNASATTLPILNKSRFEALLIPLPPLAEQTRIVAEVERRLSVIEELEAAVAANLQRASRLRQSVLQRAFSAEPSRREPSGLDARKQA